MSVWRLAYPPLQGPGQTMCFSVMASPKCQHSYLWTPDILFVCTFIKDAAFTIISVSILMYTNDLSILFNFPYLI